MLTDAFTLLRSTGMTRKRTTAWTVRGWFVVTATGSRNECFVFVMIKSQILAQDHHSTAARAATGSHLWSGG